MIVKVNDRDHQLPDKATVRQLLDELKVVGPLAVELNRKVCPKKDHETTILSDGDIIEIVTIVGGG
ncbi:MAG: sulfur carrier protein ThiS [Sedimentisphaerales bacterium]|nr:sulfur carrier protein ThiS [Sedimentisphaerales bacterium]